MTWLLEIACNKDVYDAILLGIEISLSRIDSSWVIKVADFGLSEDTSGKNYFRQEETSGVKLPVKWMALESIDEGIFTEKTDVVSPCSS